MTLGAQLWDWCYKCLGNDLKSVVRAISEVTPKCILHCRPLPPPFEGRGDGVGWLLRQVYAVVAHNANRKLIEKVFAAFRLEVKWNPRPRWDNAPLFYTEIFDLNYVS